MTLSIFAPPPVAKPAPIAACDSDPITQLRVAARNKLATAIGACAGIVPIGVFEVGHHELNSWNPLHDDQSLIVYAGLVFSALTVCTWGVDMFTPMAATRWSRVLAFTKALGFTALVEGIMMTSSNQYLAGSALALLIAVNAVANGCRLAVRAAAAQADAERVEAPAVAAPTVVTLSEPVPAARLAPLPKTASRYQLERYAQLRGRAAALKLEIVNDGASRPSACCSLASAAR